MTSSPSAPDADGATPSEPVPSEFQPIGLCSVTFRALDPARVIELAVAAGVTDVEWAGDVHVPEGDTVAAAHAGATTREAGMRVASYGSYFRGVGDPAPHLESASALGAPRMRVWAGTSGSASCAPDERAATVRSLATAAERAADLGLAIAIEFHTETLTDTPESALSLIEELDGAASLYWQPPVGLEDDAALAGLRLVLPYLSAVHAFAWWPTHHDRHPLESRAALWRTALSMLTERRVIPFIEFLPEDDPALLAREVATLRSLLPTA